MDTRTVLDFLVWMAHARSGFRELHIATERDPLFISVSTILAPIGESREEAMLSLSLLADLRRPIDQSRSGLGVAIELRFVEDKWVIDAEVGWSGKDIGWDAIDSRSSVLISLAELEGESGRMIEWLTTRFSEEAAKMRVP